MLYALIFVVCLLSSTVGGICGIGGGVIIKPVVDALGVLSVSALSFLSGLCVLSMSVISVYKQRKKRLVELRQGTLLALGAAVGGLAGKAVFDVIKQAVGETPVGLIQSVLLGLITLGTLFYMLYRSRIRTHEVKNPLGCVMIGLALGVRFVLLFLHGHQEGGGQLALHHFVFPAVQLWQHGDSGARALLPLAAAGADGSGRRDGRNAGAEGQPAPERPAGGAPVQRPSVSDYHDLRL